MNANRQTVGTTIYTTVFNKELASATQSKVTKAVLQAGLAQSEVAQLLSVVSTTELSSYPTAIVTAASAALNDAYCHAIL